jgi:hypothetical protein
MVDPSSFRDSTQIVLHKEALDGIREEMEDQFTVTITCLDGGEYARIIGSPVEIKGVSDFLVRHGVSLP